MEPSLASPSHPLNQPHQTNPYRVPHAKASEPIDQSIPSVLDSAVELLAAPTTDVNDGPIAVGAPVPLVLHSHAAAPLREGVGVPVRRLVLGIEGACC